MVVVSKNISPEDRADVNPPLRSGDPTQRITRPSEAPKIIAASTATMVQNVDLSQEAGAEDLNSRMAKMTICNSVPCNKISSLPNLRQNRNTANGGRRLMSCLRKPMERNKSDSDEDESNEDDSNLNSEDDDSDVKELPTRGPVARNNGDRNRCHPYVTSKPPSPSTSSESSSDISPDASPRRETVFPQQIVHGRRPDSGSVCFVYANDDQSGGASGSSSASSSPTKNVPEPPLKPLLHLSVGGLVNVASSATTRVTDEVQQSSAAVTPPLGHFVTSISSSSTYTVPNTAYHMVTPSPPIPVAMSPMAHVATPSPIPSPSSYVVPTTALRLLTPSPPIAVAMSPMAQVATPSPVPSPSTYGMPSTTLCLVTSSPTTSIAMSPMPQVATPSPVPSPSTYVTPPPTIILNMVPDVEMTTSVASSTKAFSGYRESQHSPESTYSPASATSVEDLWGNSPADQNVLAAEEAFPTPYPVQTTERPSAAAIEDAIQGAMAAAAAATSFVDKDEDFGPFFEKYLPIGYDEVEDTFGSILQPSQGQATAAPPVVDAGPPPTPRLCDVKPGFVLMFVSPAKPLPKKDQPHYPPILPKPEASGFVNPPIQPRGQISVPSTSLLPQTTLLPKQQLVSAKQQLLTQMDQGKKLEVELRVEKGEIDLFKQDEQGDTNLHISVATGNLEATFAIVEKLLKLTRSGNITANRQALCSSQGGSLPSPLDVANHKGQTPLFDAVVFKNALLVRYLLESGANPNKQCRDGTSPLHYVATHGREYLEVANILCQSRSINLNQRNSRGFTPLHCAVTSEKVEDSIPIIRLLLKYDARLDVEDSCNGKTALHMAVEKGSLRTVKIICASDSRIATDINIKSHLGTALHSAAQLNNITEAEQLEIVQELLNRGADRSIKNANRVPKDLVDRKRTKVRELLNQRR